MAELADAQGLGSCLFKGGGSSPPLWYLVNKFINIDNILLEFRVILQMLERSNQFSEDVFTQIMK